MIIFTFILGFVLSVSARHSPYDPQPYQSQAYQSQAYQSQSYCDTKTKHITVTNTWGYPDLTTVTSTELRQDHTVIPITNTVIIPFTTLSTLVITHLKKVPSETTVSTIWQTKLHPKTETITHTAFQTRNTQIHATETKVEYMTLTETLVKPSTTTLTTERLVETYVPQAIYEETTVTQYKTSTVQEPIYVTWNNFRTSTVHDTVYVTKGHAKPAHVYTTVTNYYTVTKCQGKAHY